MAKFLTELGVVGLNDKIWVLTQPLVYKSDLVDVVAVPVGFYTDFASVPRVPVFYTLFGDRAHRESVLHDAMYCIDFPGNISFSTANKIFLEAMEATGKPFYVRYPMYLGVCWGGWPYFHRRNLMDKITEKA